MRRLARLNRKWRVEQTLRIWQASSGEVSSGRGQGSHTHQRNWRGWERKKRV